MLWGGCLLYSFFVKLSFFNFILFKGQLVWHNYHFFTKFEFFFHLRRMNASVFKVLLFFCVFVLETLTIWHCIRSSCKLNVLYFAKTPKVLVWNKFSFQVDENYNHNYELKKFFLLYCYFCKEISFHESIFIFLVEGVFFLKQAG